MARIRNRCQRHGGVATGLRGSVNGGMGLGVESAGNRLGHAKRR